LPAHLPRQAVTHTLEHECCPDCGGSPAPIRAASGPPPFTR
jgi:transposase